MKVLFQKIINGQGVSAPQEFAKEKKEWPANLINEEGGQLAIDVYEISDNLILKSTIAGVTRSNLEIVLNHDMLTIKGERKPNEDEKGIKNYIYNECFWGKFSRTVILPVEVKAHQIEAELENGVLTIVMPIDRREQKVIEIKDKNTTKRKNKL